MIDISGRLKKNTNYYSYEEFLKMRKTAGTNDLVLCDISVRTRPFYLGADIVDAVVNNSKYDCGRAIWEPGLEPMEWVTRLPIRAFNTIGICAFMHFQIFSIPAFIRDSGLRPISAERDENDPIILLGGQLSYLFNGYDKFVDVACFGDGEDFILRYLEIQERCRSQKVKKQDFLNEVAEQIQGAYVPSVHGSGSEPIIKKSLISLQRLQETSSLDTIKSKARRYVIEAARGCKYSCGFCALSRRAYPYREIGFDILQNKSCSYSEGSEIYLFAPDDSSVSSRAKFREWCEIRGLINYSYNSRLDTVSALDVKQGTGAKTFGVDGISQRVIDIVDKRITIDKLFEIAEIIFNSESYHEIKLNYVYNFSFERDEDYGELESVLRRLIETRIKSKSKCFIHLAPTPFCAEFFIPLQFAELRETLDKRFEEIVKKIKHDYFDVKKIEPRIKIEGALGEESWKALQVVHRLENLSDLVYDCFLRGHYKPGYNKKLYDMIFFWLAKNGITFNSLSKELDVKKTYWFDKFDWSGGKLDHRLITRDRYLKMRSKF